MAVYTHLGAEDLAAIVTHYDVGELVSAKGIAEGVSNSNWLIETTGSAAQRVPGPDIDANRAGNRFILTMYEKRIDLADLPFFLGLLDHLSAKDLPVPRTIHDRDGAASRMVNGKAVALIEYLPGLSVDQPTPAQARAVGVELARLHIASRDYGETRTNDLKPADWRALFDSCGTDNLRKIDPALTGLVRMKLPELRAKWPKDLPRSIIHADLFCDNVLMRGDQVAGMIDFYFACNDMVAYDFAVTHAAWCFTPDGQTFDPEVSAALRGGYESIRPFSAEERAALPVLAQGACMRFIATRAYDWLHGEEGAMVKRKDPMDFARRLQFYAQKGAKLFSADVPTGTLVT
ncbi:homoserine kinase [Pseudopontixanthobacter vadosimaris]|uniref:homoserine kinase n=1 Tax=Pseudopontixanthobacter vadosimaris TaxID=2726450 RepID=UPI001475EA81|nr:homoserine kinase [Pseudopontixanthobacter vadosimaris]